MPYTRPTFDQLKADVAAEIASSVPGADGLLRYSNMGVLGMIQAYMAYGLYGYLDYIAKQSNPFTAIGEALEAWAALKNIFRSAAQAAGSVPGSPGEVTFAATAVTPPASIGPGVIVVRPDGAQFTTIGTATAVGNSITVTVQAVTAGATGNTSAGTQMTLGAAAPYVSSQGQVTEAIVGGADVQTDDSLRSEMLVAYANPPQGGSAADYQVWALAVVGVTRAWVAPEGLGPGTVVVYFMMDSAEAAYGGFPQGTPGLAAADTRSGAKATGDLLTVANAILAAGQPVTARVYPMAPKSNTINLTINGLAGVGATVQAAINAAIVSVLLAQGSPGGVILPQGTAGVVDLSFIEAAVAAIAGTSGFVIASVNCTNGTVTPGATGNIASNNGYLPVLGVVTYT